MICKFCGNEIEDGSDFCYVCGQKVEAEQPAADDLYSQATADDTQAVPAYAAQQTVTEAAPVYAAAQETAAQAPVYQPVAPAASVDTPDTMVEQQGKKKKKQKNKEVFQTKRGVRFVCFLFALIGLIIYSKAKKAGNEVRATECMNAIMLGLDVKLAILCVVLAKKFMF